MPTENGGEAPASPPYPHRHSGPVLVCGNAFSLHDDLARARAIFGSDAPVIAVNQADIPAFALFSCHSSKMEPWIATRRRHFPGVEFTVHATGKGEKLKAVRLACPWVDYWWSTVAKGGGTSSWGARKMAKLMGFDLVILCGAPLDHGTYANKKPAFDFMRPDVLKHYRGQVAADTEWHEGCKSMSGWTADLLGKP
jgi:hypothetical protein